MRKIIAHRSALPIPFYYGKPPNMKNPIMFEKPIEWTDFFQQNEEYQNASKTPILQLTEKYLNELTNLFESIVEDFILIIKKKKINIKYSIKISKAITEFESEDADVFKINRK